MNIDKKKFGTVLVIEDEVDVLKAVTETLTLENFQVVSATSGRQGIKMAQEKNPNIILLDLRLPDIDGFDVCRELRGAKETSFIPIIMLTTRSKDTEKILGLEIGADDYVTKPYNPLELVARIRAILRRKQTDSTLTTHLHSGLLTVDTEAREVMVSGDSIKVTRKEFDLLVVFLSKPGKVFSRSALLELVWGASYDSLQGTVDSHVKSLRKKLGDVGKSLETVTGVGYKWVGNSNGSDLDIRH